MLHEIWVSSSPLCCWRFLGETSWTYSGKCTERLLPERDEERKLTVTTLSHDGHILRNNTHTLKQNSSLAELFDAVIKHQVTDKRLNKTSWGVFSKAVVCLLVSYCLIRQTATKHTHNNTVQYFLIVWSCIWQPGDCFHSLINCSRFTLDKTPTPSSVHTDSN